MNNYIFEGDLIYCNKHNKSPITKLSRDKDEPERRLLLCETCVREKRGVINSQPIEVLYEMINKHKNPVIWKWADYILGENEKIIYILSDMLLQVNYKFNETIKNLTAMNQHIVDFCKPPDAPNFQQIEEIQKNDFIYDPVDEFYKVLKDHVKKITLSIVESNNLILPLKEVNNKFRSLIDKIKKWKNRKTQLEQPLKDFVELKDKACSEENTVRAMAFTSNYLITGSGKEIQVWQFSETEGLKKVSRLTGHKQTINCLVARRKFDKSDPSDWFASGGQDGTIITWKQREKNWEKTIAVNSHQSFILSLILNKKQDQLLSCCVDGKIKCWQVNCKNNTIELKYELQKEHLKGIALNQKESLLIAQTSNYLIPLKKNNEKWEMLPKQVLNIPNSCFMGCFISENYFAIQQEGTDEIKIYTWKEKEEKDKLQLQISIKLQKVCNCNESYFRSVLNKRRSVLVHKCGNLVYLYKVSKGRNLDDYKLVIDCSVNESMGILTENGDHFILWDQRTKRFRIFKINYEELKKK